MNIVIDNPPIIDRIKEIFPLSGREIFAWGDTIYNPSGGFISPELIAHEEVHSRQQIINPELPIEPQVLEWWEKYLNDQQFRLSQEIESHRAEYRAYCKLNRDRNIRARYLQMVASRLASPMYGSIISVRDAAKFISN